MSRIKLAPVIISIKYYHFHDHNGSEYSSGCKACKLDRLQYHDPVTFRHQFYYPDPISCDDCAANFYALKTDIVREEPGCCAWLFCCRRPSRQTRCPICRGVVPVQEPGHITIRTRSGEIKQMKDVTAEMEN